MASLPHTQIQADVAGVFLSYFQRAPEFEAMQWYSEHYIQLLAEQGNNPAARQNAYKALADQIYLDGTSSLEVPPAGSIGNSAYVHLLYHNLLGREPDPTGAAYWIQQLDSGAIARGELVAIMLEAALGGDPRDSAWVSNHITVAVAFAQWQNSNPEILPNLIYDAAEVLAGVTENPATVAEAFTLLYSQSDNPGLTFTLTPQIDEFIGTERNDTFNVVDIDPANSAPNTTTLTAFDHLDGMGGTDTLNIFANGANGTNDGVPPNAVIRNIEIVNVVNQGPVAAQHLGDTSQYEGLTEFWQLYGAANVSDLAAGVVAGFRAFHTLNVAVAVEASASTLQIAIDHPEFGGDRDSYPAILARGASLDTVNIHGNLGGDAFVRLEAELADGANTLYLNSGVSAVVLNVEDASGRAVSQVDARGSTADVGFWLDQAQTQSWGGEGNDTFNFVANMLTPGSWVDGGGGYNEVVVHEQNFQTQDYDLLNSFMNIQRVAFGSEHTTLDAAQLDFDDIGFVQWEPNRDIDNNATIFNLGAHQVLSVDQGIVADLTLANADANVTAYVARDAWLDLWIAVGPEGATGGTLYLYGDESGDVDFDNTWGRNLDTGDTEHLQQGKFAVIDASGLLGSLTLWDMAPELAETVFLGAGPDNFIFLEVNEGAGSSSSSIGVLDTVSGFHTDRASFEGMGSELEHLELSPDVGTLSEAWAEAAAAWAVTTPDVVYFHFDGDTYLYADTVSPGSGHYDNEDFGLRVLGEHDLA